MLTLTLMISFINETLKVNAVRDMKINLLTQGNIIADEVAPDFYRLGISSTRSYVESVIKKYSLDLDARILILNEHGRVQLDSYDKMVGRNFKHLLEVSTALQGMTAAELYKTQELGNIMYVTVPITERHDIIGSVLISASAEHIFTNIKTVIQKILVLSLLGILITGIVSFIFADIFSAPIERMTEVVRAITRGQHDRRVYVRGNDELANLGNAFNLMLTRLEQVDERRKQFVSNASHELRTPMASIKIISETLLSQEAWDESVYREFLGDIDQEVTRLNKIIDSLLYLVDIEKKELQLEYQITYMNYLVENVVKQLKPLADKKNIRVHFDDFEKIQIEIDKGKIQQCIINILGNAIKYTPDGGQVDVDLYRVKENVIVRITDTGIGIPEEDLPHIFERFHRVDKAQARNTGGTGLGLAIAQQIVNLHQGQIYAESEMGVGTKMYIVLPFRLEI
ncbi:sensor histidine kinase [Fusibacter sp. JL216-2]|uniref:sensor histidine kinase n=1 Tax=Fusibacter sp. JL216-2 TaxID=3071453 RepID=UPI003D33A75C